MDITSIIIIATLGVIFVVFLLFDLFERNEKYGYLAYAVALLPANFYWGVSGDPLIAYIILFALWIITLLRDTIGLQLDKNKDINEILMYLFLAIIIQLIVSAIMPEVNEDLKSNTEKLLYFWLPNIHSAIFETSSTFVLIFKLAATLLVFLIIIPLIIDIKDEEAPLPIIIIFVAIFIIPFLYLSFIWIPEMMGVLTFLFSVILFIILLIITRSGMETK